MTMLSPQGMNTLPPAQTVRPFGKINVWRLPDGSKQIRAYILLDNVLEGAKTGVAIDGSASMMSGFGRGGCLPFVGGAKTNIVSLNAQKMCAYLAGLDAEGKSRVLYWAAGDGSEIEVIGDLDAKQAATYDFAGPSRFGAGTKLLPALRYLAEEFKSAPWGMYIFVTDGALQDLEDVKKYTTQLARDIAAKQRNNLKLVIIGVGSGVDAAQMEQLDDLDTGTDVDLWDHKIATEMQDLSEIFAEVVDENMVVAAEGIVKDSSGRVLADYRDKGVPALLTFVLPPGADSFILEIAGQSVKQPIP